MVILCVEPLYKNKIGFEKDAVWNNITYKEVYKYLWGKCKLLYEDFNFFWICFNSSAHCRSEVVWLKLAPLVVGCWSNVTVGG